MTSFRIAHRLPTPILIPKTQKDGSLSMVPTGKIQRNGPVLVMHTNRQDAAAPVARRPHRTLTTKQMLMPWKTRRWAAQYEFTPGPGFYPARVEAIPAAFNAKQPKHLQFEDALRCQDHTVYFRRHGTVYKVGTMVAAAA